MLLCHRRLLHIVHLHSGFAKNNHKSITIVKHTYKHTLVSPSFEFLSL